MPDRNTTSTAPIVAIARYASQNAAVDANDTVRPPVRRHLAERNLPHHADILPPSSLEYKKALAAQDWPAIGIRRGNDVKNGLVERQGRDDGAARHGEYRGQ
ncbi:hypothetical protein SEEK9263_23003 [Salmonella enterica subsp. enterica serovar Kentucky str. ATCC 9263]|nr:hypothetical protein SEEK9263_23003 [Salmonella enterica subsp. enterica serovar Kentucky str. ATCC 9263]